MQSSTVSMWVSSLAVYMYCRSDLNALGRTCQHMCVLQEWLECTRMHLSTYIRSAGGTWMHLDAPVNIHMYCRRDLNALRHTCQHTYVLQESLECIRMHLSTYICTTGVTWMHLSTYICTAGATECTWTHLSTFVCTAGVTWMHSGMPAVNIICTAGVTWMHSDAPFNIHMYGRSDFNTFGRTCQHAYILQKWLECTWTYLPTYITSPQHICYILTYKSQSDVCLFSCASRGLSTQCLWDGSSCSGLHVSFSNTPTDFTNFYCYTGQCVNVPWLAVFVSAKRMLILETTYPFTVENEF
jgi:hypothetical protein